MRQRKSIIVANNSMREACEETSSEDDGVDFAEMSLEQQYDYENPIEAFQKGNSISILSTRGSTISARG